VIGIKVGRLILDEIEDVSRRDRGEKGDVFKHGHRAHPCPSRAQKVCA